MAQQKTYTMIKPDGVRNGHIGEIVNRFERAGLKIERMELGMVTDEQAKANYAEHEGKPFYDGLISRNPPSARSASASRNARSERAAAYAPFARATARFLFFGASRTEGCAGYQTRKGREHALSSHRRC